MGNVYPGVGVVKSAQNAIPDYLDRRQMTDVFDSVAEYHRHGVRHGGGGITGTGEGRRGDALVFPRAARVADDGAAVHGRRRGVPKESIRHPELRALERHVRARPGRGGKRPAPQRRKLSRGRHHAGSVRRTGTRGAAVDAPDAGRLSRVRTTAGTATTGTWWRGSKPGVTMAVAQQHIDALNRRTLENSGKLRKLLENARFGTVVRGLRNSWWATCGPRCTCCSARWRSCC